MRTTSPRSAATSGVSTATSAKAQEEQVHVALRVLRVLVSAHDALLWQSIKLFVKEAREELGQLQDGEVVVFLERHEAFKNAMFLGFATETLLQVHVLVIRALVVDVQVAVKMHFFGVTPFPTGRSFYFGINSLNSASSVLSSSKALRSRFQLSCHPTSNSFGTFTTVVSMLGL